VALRDREQETLLELDVSNMYEQGLLGIAFSPEGSFLYLNYTDPEGHTRVDEFPMEADGPDPDERREILFVEQPLPTHNGGSLAFGPDGYLYIALGDGGWLLEADALGVDHPTRENAQSMDTLLGKVLRIDPRPHGDRTYGIPPDNPFVDDEDARPEIWALGLRNPWRMSFDRETGDLWIADVGESDREEVNYQAASSAGGENYGWPRLEGTLPRQGEVLEGMVPPIREYGLHRRQKAIIGGYVYRGRQVPGLWGTYVFGDAFKKRLQGLRQEDGRITEHALFDTDVRALSSFGEDDEGELFVLSLAGPIYRIAGEPAVSDG
jgi:glucose/arabinose dehydrogenase